MAWTICRFKHLVIQNQHSRTGSLRRGSLEHFCLPVFRFRKTDAFHFLKLGASSLRKDADCFGYQIKNKGNWYYSLDNSEWEMIKIFIPKHYPVEVWEQYKRNGYKLCRYLAVPAQKIQTIDAEKYLLMGRDIFTTSFANGAIQENCVLAKIFEPGGRSVCLRTDRDYFEIYTRDADGTNTVAYWQWAIALRGSRQDELWSNMSCFLCPPNGFQEGGSVPHAKHCP